MKYRELVQFEPLETVVQLEQARTLATVRQLVQTYVISAHMAEQFNAILIPHLQLGTGVDHKGLLIIGNYGVGKSHLLSLIAGVAEYPDLVDQVRHPDVAQALQSIAGQFQVVRVEIPATRKSLRNTLCDKLEEFMAQQGLPFQFPADDQVSSNKDDLARLLDLFHQRYPDQGLLLVVDELLDYLRTRNHQEIILDLGFLREIGEACQFLRFRFIAGLQESLFDNPKFQFVADNLRRVKDRFAQLRIVRQDVAYVVAERLLAKTDEQRARIRAHLQPFTPLYSGMADRLEDFVRLFPVHPTYLEVFEHLAIAEKREALKTIQREMERRLDDDVPVDAPGLISYDAYWTVLQSNVVLRAIAEVREVIDMSQVVETKVQNTFARKALQPMAMRILHGLSVYRLTTDDIRAKIGLTADELQNGLCLLAPMPEPTSDFLRLTIMNCLKELIKTVSGQYITHNPENDQYYLDSQKIVDYDAKIQEKADTLAESTLDRHYFTALTRALELTDQQTYVRDCPIWEHELEWLGHGMTRRGYLFFGAPNERSTAQPPRDFYLYFLQPFEPPRYQDQQLADEVFFKLTQRDAAFDETLRRYAGAREMALASAVGPGKKAYDEKADESLRTLSAWLQTHLLTAFEVTHQGVPKKMVEWLHGQRTGDAAVGDLLKRTGAVCLAPAFEHRYPQYPKFTVRLYSRNLKQPTEDVLRWLAGGVRNQQATAVLDGLELLDGDKLKPQQSRYAKAVLDVLVAKPPGQVVNRKELVALEYGVEREAQYRLELEFLLILLAALAHSGHLTLSVAGKKLDAGNLNELTKIPLDQLLAFKHIEKPKGLPLAEWVALFDLLGLNDGLIRNENTHEEAVKQLQLAANALIERLVMAGQWVQTGLPCWGVELLPAADRDRYRQALDGLKSLLEGLQAFNTPGKLKNFTRTVTDIQGHQSALMRLQEVETLHTLAQDLAAPTGYLAAAEAVLPPADPWRASMATLRATWQTRLLDLAARSAPDFRPQLHRALQQAKDDYGAAYLALHGQARLGIQEDDRKKRLLKDPRLERLKKLAHLALFQHPVTELQARLAKVQTCFGLIKEELAATPTCPHCQFRPQEEKLGASGATVLNQLDQQMDDLLASATQTLLDSLDDPTAGRSIALLPTAQRTAVEAFLAARQLPKTISNDLVQGMQQALAGLVAIPVKPTALLAALAEGGAPCTIEQLQGRFTTFVQQMTAGKEPAKVRLVIEAE